MSSELRVKKLRGSGGYVIAALTDEQQSKASIGGPDLFLAPLCRMDTEKISKHQCTMCDKEYEGAPKIEYENPNEEVAPGLTLVEKGRYMCNTCETTIAEYREFRKEEDGVQAEESTAPEAGALPAQEEPPQVAPEQPSQPAAAAEPAPQQPVPERPAAETAAVTQQEQSLPAPATATAVSSVEGRLVYDENAAKVGTVRQIGTDASNAMVMIVARDDGTESAIPWARIRKIGEIVMLGDGNDTVQQQQSENAPPQQQQQSDPGKCGKCSFVNRQGSRFCEECGAQL